MADNSRHDAWKAGDSYDAYMGRWSRQIAPHFLDWLDAQSGLDWLEVGCGTGALSAAILERTNPRSLICIDPSDGFVQQARANVDDARADFQVGDARALSQETASRDIVVSALVLNFVPDRAKALGEMKRVVRSGGTAAFYVWDYPGGGVEFMRAFWIAAAALDASAADLSEDKRFPFCTPEALTALAETAGLAAVECMAIEVSTLFRDFDDFWRPFTMGAGPAPGYCMSLDPDARQRLEETLRESLPCQSDGTIPMKARAWAIRSKVG